RPRRVEHGRTALRRRVHTRAGGAGSAKGRRHGGGHGIGDQHAGRCVEVHPSVTQRRMQSAHPGDVVSHEATLELPQYREIVTVTGATNVPVSRWLPEPGHPGSHTSPVGLWFGTLLALFLLIAPGTIVARITQLTWPIAIAVGPA